MTKTSVVLIWVVGVAVMWFGCASGPQVVGKDWPFEANGIELKLLADSNLNLYQDAPSTLVVCVYQLTDKGPFISLRKDREGLVKLIACQPFGDSVVDAQRVILHPGETRTLTMDRVKKTQLVGFVAGYLDANAKDSTHLYAIPLLTYKEGWGPWTDVYQWPKKLGRKIHLDSRGIRPDRG